MAKERLTKEQRRMRQVVGGLQKYISTYDKQSGYDTYSDRTFIDDVLYGLGIALDPVDHSFGDGFDKFKDKLREHLGSRADG